MKGKKKIGNANPAADEAADDDGNAGDTEVRGGVQEGDAEEKEADGEGQLEGGGKGEGEGEEGEGEEEEEEEEEGKTAEDDGHDERSKLDDGFYEIEAIRRKRVRKGQLQFFIKWRGWPETANTWEPLENLQSCSDVIDAFEASLRSGKSFRKRKRKYGGPHTQPRKKQLRPTLPSYNGTNVEVSVVDKLLPSVPINNSDPADFPALIPFMDSGQEEENNGNASHVKKAVQMDENGSASGSKQIDERKEENEYDPKLSELKGTTSTNEVNTDKFAVRFQEGKPSESTGPTNGLPKVDCVESVQSNRCTGAKRRKSGSVKRFKQDLASCELVLGQHSMPNITTGYGSTVAQLGIENSGLMGHNLSHKHKSDDSINVSAITKILKPIGFSASVSDNVQDVSVTFMAMSSDGKEVVVDNQFLKANNPLLLINFYEQHLKYSTT